MHYTIQYSLLVLFVGDSGYCGTCCCACLACQLSDRLDEHTFLPLCIGIVPLRQKIRMMFGIRVRSTPKRSSPPGAKLEPGRCQSVCRTRAPEKKAVERNEIPFDIDTWSSSNVVRQGPRYTHGNDICWVKTPSQESRFPAKVKCPLRCRLEPSFLSFLCCGWGHAQG